VPRICVTLRVADSGTADAEIRQHCCVELSVMDVVGLGPLPRQGGEAHQCARDVAATDRSCGDVTAL
jgi:hypothetical protein